jgi:hypothetical protein
MSSSVNVSKKNTLQPLAEAVVSGVRHLVIISLRECPWTAEYWCPAADRPVNSALYNDIAVMMKGLRSCILHAATGSGNNLVTILRVVTSWT